MSKVKFKIGDRVTSTCKLIDDHDTWHAGRNGTVRALEGPTTSRVVGVEFDGPPHEYGHNLDLRLKSNSGWWFYPTQDEGTDISRLQKLPKATKAQQAKKPSQAYRGNGKHAWEPVIPDNMERLRVPSGYLYRRNGVSASMTFVPMPDFVHKI